MPHEYPPPGHVLRQLAVEVHPAGDGAVELRCPVHPGVLHPAGGVRCGVLATAADVAGGLLSARTVFPDWIATAALTLDQLRPTVDDGDLRLPTRVLRAGRSMAVLGFDVLDRLGTVGHGTMTFTRLARRDTNPELPGDGPRSGPATFAADPPAAEPLPALAGVRLVDIGVAELDLTDVVRNSLGSVQGGMLGLVAEMAAETAGASELGRAARTLDLGLDYVAVARQGPVRARAVVVRSSDDWARCRVEVVDTGQERLAVVAHATVVAV